MRGKIRDIIPLSVSFLVSLEVDDIDESLMDKELSVDLKPFKERRSLSANAYFHVLCGQLAAAVGCSLTEMKNQLIADYGQYSFTERDGMVEIDTMLVRDDIDWKSIQELHLSPTGDVTEVDGKTYCKYFVMRGSHTLNSSEMALLIEGCCYECKAVGVKTLDDLEIERMVEKWQPK